MRKISYWDFDEKKKMVVQKTITSKKQKAKFPFEIKLSNGKKFFFAFETLKKAKEYASACADMALCSVLSVKQVGGIK